MPTSHEVADGQHRLHIKLIVRPSRLTAAGDRAFGVVAPCLWNDLPMLMPFLHHVRLFSKKSFKMHLLTPFV